MDVSQILSELKAEVARLENAIAALEGSGPRRGRPLKSVPRKRTMSPAARRRISVAMKLKWAQRIRKSPAKNAPAKEDVRKSMSPAARKKLAALMKARWAERKKAGAKSL